MKHWENDQANLQEWKVCGALAEQPCEQAETSVLCAERADFQVVIDVRPLYRILQYPCIGLHNRYQDLQREVIGEFL